MKKDEVIYTDGACSGNPGPGGWSAVLIYNEIEKQISGGKKETTNNEMELTAVVKALSALKEECNVTLYSDSAYVINSLTKGWLENWINSGWQTADHKPVKNVELWKELNELIHKQNVKFEKVKGHSDVKYNNICDSLARNEAAKF